MNTVTVKKWSSANKCQIYLDKVLFTDMDETRGLVMVWFSKNFEVSLDLKDWLLKTNSKATSDR